MLTPKRATFAKHYALTGNAARSAIDAGYSRLTAKQQGSKLLTFIDVQQRVEDERQKLAERTDVEEQEIIRGLYEIASDESQPAAPRVSAWSVLARVKGMFDAPVGDAQPLQVLIDKLTVLQPQPKVIEAEPRALEAPTT